MKQSNSAPIDDCAVFEWELKDAWGYGSASFASPESGLREVAAEAVRTGAVSLRWRLEDDEELDWQTPGPDGPVPDVRVLSHSQIAELGAAHRDHPEAYTETDSLPDPTEYPKNYIVKAVLAGAVPTLCDLQIGLEALKIYMLGLLERPDPVQSASICTEPEAFAYHCDALIQQLNDTAVEYRQAAARAAAAGRGDR